MDTNSKLPKPSRLKPPSSVNKPSVKPLLAQNMPKFGGPKRILRRSMSMNEMRPPTSTFYMRQPAEPLIMSRAATKISIQPSTSRVGTKRAAPSTTTKNDPATKPKVAKQAKIPDWDYKSRFQALSEKHIKLQEECKKLKEQVEGSSKLQESYDNIVDKHATLEKLYEESQIKNKNLTEKLLELNNVLNELNNLKVLYEGLATKNNDMTCQIEVLSKENIEYKDSLDKKTTEVNRLTADLCKINEEHNKIQLERRDLNNQVQMLKGNIRVYCKVRPALDELEQQRQLMITFPDEKSIVVRPQKESISSISGRPTDCKQEFAFDYVFTHEATQSEFFEEISQLVQSAIDGYHVCVFAYGQTGSGKTYTMQGWDDPEHIGMIPRTVDLIFAKIKTLNLMGWVYEAKASFLEIYNENLRDLLDPTGNQNLDIYFNEGKGTTVTNLKIVPISSYQEFEGYMKLSHKNRMVAATDFNEHSSRSHAITKIYLSGTNLKTNTTYTGSVNLVDLAGSESARTSHGDRLVETKNINKSLSTLGSVMLALHNKDKHIPFRNSKLTYLLQSCLGGNSKTLMIVNVSPCEDNFGETINSLRFASTVKKVKTKITRNKGVLPLSAINPSSMQSIQG